VVNQRMATAKEQIMATAMEAEDIQPHEGEPEESKESTLRRPFSIIFPSSLHP
jgi:hypothetical protein